MAEAKDPDRAVADARAKASSLLAGLEAADCLPDLPAGQPASSSHLNIPTHQPFCFVSRLLLLLVLVQGSIPKISDLPAPWGDKPYTAPADDALTSWGYLPAKYPTSFSPLTDQDVAAA